MVIVLPVLFQALNFDGLIGHSRLLAILQTPHHHQPTRRRRPAPTRTRRRSSIRHSQAMACSNHPRILTQPKAATT